jgi:hypothetical protein
MQTWGKICEALREEFEPFLPTVMPPLLRAASLQPDISIMDRTSIPICLCLPASCVRYLRQGTSMLTEVDGSRLQLMTKSSMPRMETRLIGRSCRYVSRIFRPLWFRYVVSRPMNLFPLLPLSRLTDTKSASRRRPSRRLPRPFLCSSSTLLVRLLPSPPLASCLTG